MLCFKHNFHMLSLFRISEWCIKWAIDPLLITGRKPRHEHHYELASHTRTPSHLNYSNNYISLKYKNKCDTSITNKTESHQCYWTTNNTECANPMMSL